MVWKLLDELKELRKPEADPAKKKVKLSILDQHLDVVEVEMLEEDLFGGEEGDAFLPAGAEHPAQPRSTNPTAAPPSATHGQSPETGKENGAYLTDMCDKATGVGANLWATQLIADAEATYSCQFRVKGLLHPETRDST